MDRRTRRSLLVRASALAALALTVLLGAAGPAPAANSGFVSVSDGQFVLNGRTFHFVGTNAYYLIPAATWGNLNYTDESMAMAQSLGLTVFRTWGFFNDPSQPTSLQPWPGAYNEASFQAMDYVLHKADQAGIRLLISLVNRWTDFGGMDRYVSWCAPGSNFEVFYSNAHCRQLYKDYVGKILNRVNTYNGRRYKDDPTVFAWELANELETSDGFDPSGQLVRGWIAEMAAFVKSIDPNHMVTTGEQGYDTTSAGYTMASYNNQAWLFNGHKGISFSENTADPNIDFASIHLYPEYWNLSVAGGDAWIADHARIARQLGKPLVVGEFGYRSNTAAVYDQWLKTAEREDVGGSLMWQLMCQSCYAMRDDFGVVHPPDGAVSSVLRQAAQVANSKNGSAPAPAPAPAPPPASPPAPSSPPPPATTAFTIGTTTASPTAATPGQGVAIATSVQAAASATALVDLEVYNASGTKIAQQVYSNQSFSAGQTRTYSWTWPGAAGAGTYTVKVGVFRSDWGTLYDWRDPAATVTVQATPAAPASTSFTIGTTSASPSTATASQGVAIGAAVTATAGATALVDLEVYNASGTKIAQQVYSNQSFSAGQTRTYSWTWPGAASAGTYTVKVGVFRNDWGTLYAWKDPAATVTVGGNGITPPATAGFVVQSTSVSPGALRPRAKLTTRTYVQAGTRASALIDWEIFNAAGTRVAQKTCTLSFSANQTRSCTWTYTIPSNLPSGQYTVKVGLFSTNWSTMHQWVDPAGTFTVQ